MKELKQTALNGVFWSFIESFSGQIVQFVVGLILARLLSPHEFGIIGMITIFMVVSQSFVDSGFGHALIRKKDCTEVDYSTVFYFNLTVSTLLFFLLFYYAGDIGYFFKNAQVKPLIRVVSVSIIINAIGSIQQTIFTKQIDFKVQTKIGLIAAIISGIIAITMAFNDFGVWSLVALTLSRSFVLTFLFWKFSSWRPSLIFSKSSFSELFGFGSNLLLSGLIDTAYNNSFLFFIAKYYSVVELGFYTRATQFRSILSENITSIISRVSYPLLSDIQDERERFKVIYIKLVRLSMLVSFLLMLGLAAVSDALVITLIGEKWQQAVPYLQLLCFVGILNPLHALNLNLLKVLGRSDLFLRLEFFKKIVSLPVIVIGLFYGIKIMIFGMIINSIVALFLNAYWTGKFINYSIFDQFRDILPGALFALFVILPAYALLFMTNFAPMTTLVLQVLTAGIMILVLGELKLSTDYTYLRVMIFNFLNRNAN